MKSVKYLLGAMLLSTLIMTGCETMKNAGGDTAVATITAVAAVANIRYYYEDGKIVNFINHANLSEQEAAKVVAALNEIDMIKSKMKVYETAPQNVIRDLDALKMDYFILRDSYISIRTIVVQHFEEYPVEARIAFVDFDNAIKEVDVKVRNVNSIVEANQTVQTIIQVADLTFKVAALM